MFSSHNISRFIRIVGYVIIAITFAFLINNFLNYWADWPGVKKLLANYGLFGFEKLKNPISGSLFTYALFQLFLYIVLIFLVVFFVFKTPNQTLNKDSEILSSLSAYIIRSAFWMVFIVGLVDLTISFLATEKLLIIIFNEKIHLNLISPPFRIKFIHVPLIFVSMILGYFTRTLGFIWLAILVIFAEFSIVITRFIFSYEQAFMGDLVRFWYGALFLFASAHALIHEGHVRVDVLYTNFSDRARAWTNTIGSFLFGIPLCLTILFLGMSVRQVLLIAHYLVLKSLNKGQAVYMLNI